MNGDERVLNHFLRILSAPDDLQGERHDVARQPFVERAQGRIVAVSHAHQQFEFGVHDLI